MRLWLILTSVVTIALVVAALLAGSQPAQITTIDAATTATGMTTTRGAPTVQPTITPSVTSATASSQAPAIESNPSTEVAPTVTPEARSGGNKSRVRQMGSLVLLKLPITPHGFERIYIAYKSVEMDYFKKPKRNDTVVKIYGFLNDEARREFAELSYNSSNGVVDFILSYPDTVTPDEFMKLVEELRRELPIGDVYFASRLEYAVLITRKNATVAEGPVADIIVLDDEDFKRLSLKYLGYEVDPCSNVILLPSDYGTMFTTGQVVEAFIPLAWYGVRSSAARAFLQANILFEIRLLNISAFEADGYIGKCFAESFVDVPPYKTYAIVEVPEKAARYVHYKNWEYRYEIALQHPERLTRAFRESNVTRYINWYRERLDSVRKTLQELKAEIGLN